MIKKFIFGSIFILVAVLGFLYYILQKHQQPVDSVYNAVPLDASVIIDIKNYNSFRNKTDNENVIWSALTGLELFRNVEKQLCLLDSLQNNFSEIKKLLTENPQIYISFHLLGKSPHFPVYYLKINTPGGFRDIIELLNKITGAVVTERKYEGEIIRDVILPNRGGNFSIVHVRGLLIMSPSAILAENSVRQLSAKGLLIQEPLVGELIKTAGKNNPVNIFIRNHFIPKFLVNVIQPKYQGQLNFITMLGGWTELDLNMDSEKMVLSGFSFTGTDSIGLAAMFNGLDAQKMEILNIVPNDAIMVFSMGFSNYDKFIRKQQQYLEYLNQWGNLKILRDSIVIKLNTDIFQSFNAVFDNECALIVTPGTLDSLETSSFSAIRIKSQDETERLLTNWIENMAELFNDKPSDYINEVKFDKDFSVKFFHFPNRNIPTALFGNVFSKSTNEFCTIFENYLIFGHSEKALTDYVSYISKNTVLSSDPEFKSLAENFSSTSHVFFYIKPNSPVGFYKNFFTEGITENIAFNKATINNLGAFAYQFSATDNLKAFNNIIVKKSISETTIKAKTNWETKLGSRVTYKPVVLKNASTNEPEILVQDEKNTVYLLNASGRILWKQYIDGPILGQVYPIDFYKNRKIQYMFNSASKLYLIDRLGRYVEGYPVALPYKATNGIAVFDYGNNRKYRIFYANANKELILLNKEGKPEKGWTFGKTDGVVSKPVQHFVANNSDYIVFADNKRLYFTNRKGEIKFNPKKEITVSKNNSVYLYPNSKKSKPLFVVTDSLGMVYTISLKGEINTIDLGVYPANHFFELRDINNDKKPVMIFAAEQKIKAFSFDTKEILNFKTHYPIHFKPEIIDISKKNIDIGVVAPNAERIYVYDMSGNILKGFPVTGSSQFSVILLNNSEIRYNLIVGTNNNFLLNYTVQ